MTQQTGSIGVVANSHDEGSETLTLSNASDARIADATATGTIENSDPMPRALMARFGPTAAMHAVEELRPAAGAGGRGCRGQGSPASPGRAMR